MTMAAPRAVTIERPREGQEIVRSPHLTGKADVTILLPAHNEAACIERVIREFHAELSKRLNVEIVVVEDGSKDGTKEIVKRLAEELPILADMADFRRGYSPAITQGAKHASSTYVLFTDSDGQHFPEDFWKLWDVREGNDIVTGARTPRADSRFRKLMSGVFVRAAKLLFPLRGFRDVTAPFRLVKAPVAADLAGDFRYMRESFWTEFTIRAAHKGYVSREVPVRHRPALRAEATVVYKPSQLPRIVTRQFKNLLTLRGELKGNHRSIVPE